jgi:thiol-disulfide isomerase/thioredoxin
MAPFLALILAVGGCDKQSDPAPQAPALKQAAEAPPATPSSEGEEGPLGTLDRSKAGTPMPDKAFEAPNGQPVHLADFKGAPLLVNLWATWCGPCVAEMPALDEIAETQGAKLQVIVVSQDSQGRAIVDPWWAKHSFKRLKPYIDAKSDLGFAFSTGMVPTTVLYDAAGKEVWRVIGAEDWAGADAAALIAEGITRS